MSELVSIVVPVYNVEKYLDRCLNSIVNQTYSNLEIILVDDGSTDTSGKICDVWAEKDDRILVVHKENSGLGMARNTGIEKATGAYVCFFDSDDYIALNLVEKCYSAIVANKADVSCYGFNYVDSAGQVVGSVVPYGDKTVFEGEEIQRIFLPDMIAPDPELGGRGKYHMSACAAMFSLELIRFTGWRFVSEREIISEDVYSLLDLYKHINKVVVIQKGLYYYCRNNVSLTRSYRADRYIKVRHFYLECLVLCKNYGYSADIMHRLTKPFLSFTIAALKQEAAVVRPKIQTLSAISKIINDDVLQRVLMAVKKDKDGYAQKVLFWAIRKKCARLCWILLKLKMTIKP